MPGNKIHITDERMLKVMDYVISHKIQDVTTKKAFCLSIGASDNNLSNIRKGTQQFHKEHLYLCCKKYGISADYIFGFTKDMHTTGAKTSPIERIREALNEIELVAKGL